MDRHREVEKIIADATRRYLCSQHDGAKALLELFRTIEGVKGRLSEARLLEIIDYELSRPPGYQDPQNLEAQIGGMLMRFQYDSNQGIERVVIEKKDFGNGGFPFWGVEISLEKIFADK